MSEENKVAIYILNWNQYELTIDCVRSLLEQKCNFRFDITIVDNGSTDGSTEKFTKNLPKVPVINNKINKGFQGGMNVGLADALNKNTEFILLLNNDTIVAKDMLQQLVNRFPEDAGLVSPMLYYFEAPEKPWSVGGDINPVLLEVMEIHKDSLAIPEKIISKDFIPSCAWLLRSSVVQEVGLLDERFHPIYYDDLDYCLRLKHAGYKTYIIPEAKLWHKVSLSMGGQYSPGERFLMARNSGYYFRKHMKTWQAPVIFIYRLGSLFLWSIRLGIKGKFHALANYWKGFLQGWFSRNPK